MCPNKHIAIIVLMTAQAMSTQAAGSFSGMGVGEVSMLLDMAVNGNAAGASSAKDAAPSDKTCLSVTAMDMLTKIYGAVDPCSSREECIRQSEQNLRLTPIADGNVLWVDSCDGYVLDYYGMAPEVSALATYDNGDSAASDFGFFFLFPYTVETRQQRIVEQADFCGTLLQELADEGLPMDLNTTSDDLFEAVGDYKGSLVDVRLLDDRREAGAGRYILILTIEPNAFTPADNQLAL